MPLRRACLVVGLAIGLAIELGGGACSPARRDPPSPVECVAAADCAPGPLVDPGDVCCDSGVHLSVFSRKYLEWRAQVRAADCQAHACPALPPPAPPLPCATEPRCVANRCTGSCTP